MADYASAVSEPMAQGAFRSAGDAQDKGGRCRGRTRPLLPLFFLPYIFSLKPIAPAAIRREITYY
nr:MAG TPA: hypothetical protein [Caudoviricetes sp.]